MIRFFENLCDSIGIALTRKQAKDQLRESEEKYRTFFNNAEVGMFRSRVDGSAFLETNDKFLAMLGWTREEVIGKPTFFIWPSADSRAEAIHALQATGRIDNLEQRLLNKDGQAIDCLLSARLDREQGIVEGALVDITARKQAEAEQQELQQQLHHMDRVQIMGELASSLAHEVCQPLAGILSNAQAAQRFLVNPHPM